MKAPRTASRMPTINWGLTPGSSGPVPSPPCSSSTDRPDARAHRSGCRGSVPRHRVRRRASCRRCCGAWCGAWAWLAPGDVETLVDGDENVRARGKADVAVLRGCRVGSAGCRANCGADDGALGVLADDLADD